MVHFGVESALRDEALIAFPGILIFAVILGTSKLYISLLVFVLFNILAIGLVNQLGIYQHETLPPDLGAASLICILLLLTTYCVWLLASDFKLVLKNLSEENIRVKESQQQIQTLLHHDVLTHLPNRTLAKDRFSQAIARCKRSSQFASLLFIDLDDFKSVNDSLGHYIGDQLLIEISNRLVRRLRETDTVCRLGGDEFLVILENLNSRKELTDLVKEILHSVILPYHVKGNDISVTCSIGVTTVPVDGVDFDLICGKADLAMYVAKDKGKNSFIFYEQQMDDAAQSEIHLVSDLRKAIRDDQLWLAYQPKIELGSGKIVGAEALLRWNHPTLGLISPDRFIHLAESSGSIVEIGKWVIQQACKQCREWKKRGHEHFVVAVNVSPIQFKRGDLVEFVLKTLQECDLEGSGLEIELTESLFLDHSPQLEQSLADLRSAGVTIAIDDFGTGYSNLGYLRDLHVSALKIDQLFVQRMLDSKEDKAIVSTIIQIASSLGLASVAEGIETSAIAQSLHLLGCNFGQGYHWSKPINAQAFSALLSQHTQKN